MRALGTDRTRGGDAGGAAGAFCIALGYEGLNDHDQLRHDPMIAVLAGKLEAGRSDCAPVAGKSTLNRLELSRLQPTRYHKVSHNPIAINGCWSACSWRRMSRRWARSSSISMRRTIRFTASRKDHGYYDCYRYLPLYIFCGRHLLAAKLRSAVDAAVGTV
jgi:hypothetical protein